MTILPVIIFLHKQNKSNKIFPSVCLIVETYPELAIFLLVLDLTKYTNTKYTNDYSYRDTEVLAPRLPKNIRLYMAV